MAFVQAQAEPQAGPQDHQPCGIWASFDHDEDDDKIDWGVMTLCFTDTFYIYMEGVLEYYHPALNQYIQFDFIEETCNTYICIEYDTFNNDPAGSYRVKHCFEAESAGSSWPWSCDYFYYSIN